MAMSIVDHSSVSKGSSATDSIDEIEPKGYNPSELEQRIKLRQRQSMDVYRKTS